MHEWFAKAALALFGMVSGSLVDRMVNEICDAIADWIKRGPKV